MTAVEVIATLGDSIVGVRHVIEPRGGRAQPVTRALGAGGAIAVGAGLLAFVAATRIAAANQEALAAWVAAANPAWAFRPDPVPAWLSVVAFLGVSGGLTALVAALARWRREREPATVSIGSAAGVDFAIAGTAAPRVELVAPDGDGFVLALAGLTGEVTGPDGVRAIDASATAVPVVRGLRARAAIGAVTFHIAAVEAPRRQATPVLAYVERRTLVFFAASAAAHLGVWGLARGVPPGAQRAPSDLAFVETLTYRTAGIATDEAAPAEPELEDSGPNPILVEEGQIGKVEPSPDPVTYRMARRSDGPEIARQHAIEAARAAGVLGTESLAAGGVFASLTGTGAVSSGFDDIDVYGGLYGDGTYGDPQAFGRRGNAFGGGERLILTSVGHPTINEGERAGDSYGVGCEPMCRERKPRVPSVRIGKPDVIGEYDKEIIRRHVRRKAAAIAYCYERELLASPGLEGTVLAEWTITADGGVMEPRASGVHPTVSTCIATVIGTIQFPRPPAVGVFKVRYPFELQRTGGS